MAHPIIARIGEYTQAEAYLQDGLDLAFTGGLHPGENRFGVLDVALVGQVFGVNTGTSTWISMRSRNGAVDFLLAAGDGYGGTTALFDGGVVETAGGVGVAVAPSRMRYCSTLDDMA